MGLLTFENAEEFKQQVLPADGCASPLSLLNLGSDEALTS